MQRIPSYRVGFYLSRYPLGGCGIIYMTHSINNRILDFWKLSNSLQGRPLWPSATFPWKSYFLVAEIYFRNLSYWLLLIFGKLVDKMRLRENSRFEWEIGQNRQDVLYKPIKRRLLDVMLSAFRRKADASSSISRRFFVDKPVPFRRKAGPFSAISGIKSIGL